MDAMNLSEMSWLTIPIRLERARRKFDWLGHGFYIWENNYERALRWSEDKFKRGTITKPSVVGVIYQLDYCLDFTDSKFIDILCVYHRLLKDDLEVAGKTLPKNKEVARDAHKDLLLRELDCAVIEYLHQKIEDGIKDDEKSKGFSKIKRFDTTRGIFTEGGPAYEGAGIQTKNHIQICIRNLNCIKGFFIPREEIKFP